jgi:DNA-binding response OmpR family regulator
MNKLSQSILLAIVVLSWQVTSAQDPMPPAAAPAAPPKAATPTIEAANRDVAVETIIDSKPTSPAELLQAAAILADLGRADLAKAYLQQLAAMNPGEAALAEAAGKVDADVLMRLVTNEALRPEGRTLASAVLAAGAKRSRDPQRLKAVVNRLADPSRQVQREAMIEILAARDDAVPALLVALADSNRARVHAMARQTLVQIGEPAVGPLTAALESDNAALKVQMIDVLAQIGLRDAAIFLVAPAVAESSPANVKQAAAAALESLMGVRNPTVSDAQALLAKEIERYVTGKRPVQADADGKVLVWRFDAASGLPVREIAPRDEAGAIVASRLADDLLEIAPEDALAKRLYLVSHLQASVYRNGLDRPLPANDAALAKAKQFGAPATEDALKSALFHGQLPAAQGAAQALGDVGDASYLQSTGASFRPIVMAVSHGDRRVRFAAAEAIMKWQPKPPFAGSSSLVETLAWFAGSPGEKRALVAFPTDGIGSELASMLGALGYRVDVTTWGHQTYLQALRSGDYELALLSGRLDHPPLWVLIQELRRSPRTAKLPIAFMGEDGDGDWQRSIAPNDPLTAVIERPVTPESMKLHVGRLVERTEGSIVPAEVRSEQALASLKWLKLLNEVSPRDFNVRQYEKAVAHSLYSPAHSAAAADLLASIGTNAAQKALVDLANLGTQPMAMRQTAAAAFSRSVRKHGVQLTSIEMQEQYDRYNASEGEDADSQQLLALILDAIELPHALQTEGGRRKAEGGK